MWCPKCKNEYREGFTHCPDCDVDLVDDLTQVLTPIIFGEKEAIDQMCLFLRDQGIEEAQCKKDEKDKTFELFVYAKNEAKTKELLNGFLAQMAMQEERAENGFDDEEADDEETDDDSEESKTPTQEFVYAGGGDEEEENVRVGTYESNRHRAEEYKASSVALLVVGIIGAVAVALLFFDVLPIRLYGSSKILICSVMEVMFIAFLFGGYKMSKGYKDLVYAAGEEEERIAQIKAFLEETVTKEYVQQKAQSHIPDGRSLSDLSEEQIYFPRMEAIKAAIKEQSPAIDDLLLEKLSDDWYSSLYDS